MTTYVHKEATWKELRSDGFAVNVGVTPRMLKEAYAHAGGTWRSVHVTDTTGPAATPGAVARWLVGGLGISWGTPPDADYKEMQVRVFHQNEATVRAEKVVPRGTGNWVCPYAPYGIIMRVELVPYDEIGNAGTKTTIYSMAHLGGARGRVPSPIVFDSNSSGTWRNGAWREDIWADKYYVYQGSSVTGKSEGAYFYGDAIWNALHGTTITDMSWQYMRTNSTGLGGGIQPEIWMSSIASRADTMSKFGTKVMAPAVCRNGDCTPYNSVTLPASWRAPMVDPDAPNRFRSIVLSSDDTTLRDYIGNVSESYMAMYPGYARPLPNNPYVPGRLIIAHTG